MGCVTSAHRVHEKNDRTKEDRFERSDERVQSSHAADEGIFSVSEAETQGSKFTSMDGHWGKGYTVDAGDAEKNVIRLVAEQYPISCLSDGNEVGLWMRASHLGNRWRRFQDLPDDAFGKPLAGDACIVVAPCTTNEGDDCLDPDPDSNQALAVRSALVSGVAEAAAEAIYGFVRAPILSFLELSEVSWNLAQAFLSCPNVAGIIASHAFENYWDYDLEDFLTAPKRSLLSDSTFPLPSTLLPVFDHIWIWIEYCCLPQAPLTPSQQEEKFREIGQIFCELQRSAVTLVLNDKYAPESGTNALTLSSFLLLRGRALSLQPFRSDTLPRVAEPAVPHNLETIARATLNSCRSSSSLAPILDVWKQNSVRGSKRMQEVLANLLHRFFISEPICAKFGYEGAFLSSSQEIEAAILSGYLEHSYTVNSLTNRFEHNIMPDSNNILHVIKLDGENILEDGPISAMITEHADAGFDVIVSNVIPFSSGIHIKGVALSKKVRHVFTRSAQQFPYSQLTNAAMCFAMGASTSTTWIGELTRQDVKEATIEAFVRSYTASVILNLDTPISKTRGWFPAEILLPQLTETILKRRDDELSSDTETSEVLQGSDNQGSPGESSKSFFLTLMEAVKNRPNTDESIAWGTSYFALNLDFFTAFAERRGINCKSDGNEKGIWLKASQLGNQLLRHQEIPKNALGKPKVGDACLFVSHRWASREHPDPEGQQATAIRAAVLATLAFAASFVSSNKDFKGFAGFTDCGILAQSLLRCPGPTGHLVAWARDHTINHDIKVGNLSELLSSDRIPSGFSAAMDRVWLWIDFCCLPQYPRTSEEQFQFRVSLCDLAEYQKNAATLVLYGEGNDLHTRGWCVFEYIASRGKAIGVEEDSRAQIIIPKSNILPMGAQLKKLEETAADAVMSIPSSTSSLETTWAEKGITCSNGDDLGIVVSNAMQFLLKESYYGIAGYQGVFTFACDAHECFLFGAVGQLTTRPSDCENILHIIKMIGEDELQDPEVSDKFEAHQGHVVVSQILPNISRYFVQGVLAAPTVTHVFTHRASLFPSSGGIYSQGFCLAMGSSQETRWLKNMFGQFGLEQTEENIRRFVRLYQVLVLTGAENFAESNTVLECHHLTRRCFEDLLEKEGRSAEVNEMRRMFGRL